MADTVRLHAAGLRSKWGFDDGDALRGGKAALVSAVREHLLPRLDPGVVVYEITTHHNPIRATPETSHLIDDSVWVDLLDSGPVTFLRASAPAKGVA